MTSSQSDIIKYDIITFIYDQNTYKLLRYTSYTKKPLPNGQPEYISLPKYNGSWLIYIFFTQNIYLEVDVRLVNYYKLSSLSNTLVAPPMTLKSIINK